MFTATHETFTVTTRQPDSDTTLAVSATTTYDPDPATVVACVYTIPGRLSATVAKIAVTDAQAAKGDFYLSDFVPADHPMVLGEVAQAAAGVAHRFPDSVYGLVQLMAANAADLQTRLANKPT